MLSVHHIKYNGDPWEAPNESLITLCDNCHKREHNYSKVIGCFVLNNDEIYEEILWRYCKYLNKKKNNV